MLGLNDKQWEACSYTEGPLLILAGAGSGKTRVLVHRIAYLIEEKGVDPYNILAITFTNKAANEMKERVEAAIDVEPGRIWVSTFHSMCVKILRRFYSRIGGNNNFAIYDTDDQKSVCKEVLKTLNLDPKTYKESACIAFISNAKECCKTPEDLELEYAADYRNSQLVRVYREYQNRMKMNNALDFDDLIFKTLDLFTQDQEVLEYYQDRFKYIMVDEYQDTNESQFQLVRFLAGKWRNLCVVGDDDQSIYKFRGANIYNILNFEDEYTDAKVVKLEQNYRSTQTILDAANAVIANNTGRKVKRLWTENGQGEKIHYTVFETEHEEAHGAANTIMDLCLSGRDYSDIAILYRTNAQSRAIEEKLVYANIPYKLVGGTGFYNRKEIRDIVAYLKLLSNTSDEIAFSRIINVPKRGIGATTVSKIREQSLSNGLSMYDFCKDDAFRATLGRSSDKIGEFIEMMESFRPLVDSGELEELFDAIMEKTGYEMDLRAEATDEARGRLENLEELRNKIVGYMEEDEPSLMGLLEDISLVADTDDKAEDSDNKVTLMTLHSAKGLEFPVVFIVGMEERLFPSGMAMDSDDPDAVEEERRLCYVGITRAKELLYLSSCTTRMSYGNRAYNAESRFIEEIPKEYMTRTGVKANVIKAEPFAKKPSVSGFNFGVTKPKTAAVTKTKTSSDDSSVSVSYGVGDRVKHIKFGKGTVTAMNPSAGDYEITVNFDTVGEKHMFAKLAKLKKI
ncbi:DNA helicase-2 / ATP-dependent DNA helicase PcrA [Lachnospiraceae bacterium NE2001]|nr:DNA helicase-2 / ATP-dependent DNA helicase PcrA [Lachnospiraceae bacterium NE2001]